MNGVENATYRTMTVTVNVPGMLALMPNDVREMVAVLLFRAGKTSPEEACGIIGVGPREFDEILAAHGFTPTDGADPAGEIAAAEGR